MFLAILAALRCGLLNKLNLRGNLITSFLFMQVRITLIASGFKRQVISDRISHVFASKSLRMVNRGALSATPVAA
jgi:hypothetical protein